MNQNNSFDFVPTNELVDGIIHCRLQKDNAEKPVCSYAHFNLGNILVTEPVNLRETVILDRYETKSLFIKDLDGKVLFSYKPMLVWTHKLLNETSLPYSWLEIGINVYLGDKWIGSTEI